MTVPIFPDGEMRLSLPSAPNLVLTIRCVFIVVRSSGRDDPDCIFSLREYDEIGLAIDFANRLATLFSIVLSPVDAFQPAGIHKDPNGKGEIKLPNVKGRSTLFLVPLEYHMGGIAV
jgi:hypothetical protein